MAKKISGTTEWAEKNVNILLGCQNGCRYCYARAQAMRFNRLKNYKDWGTTYHYLREDMLEKTWRPTDKRIMFPSSHDIYPEILDECVTVLGKILAAGNDVVIVSKPSLECIKRLCHEFQEYQSQIVFRFTIGATDDKILSHWEPNAPSFKERLAALKWAFRKGFATSVSCEPLLDAPKVKKLFDRLKPYVTDSIWIGKMNLIRNRVDALVSNEEIERIEAGQTPEAIGQVYEQLKDEPLVRWKDNYMQEAQK
jgi:DNA repair photolyase